MTGEPVHFESPQPSPSQHDSATTGVPEAAVEAKGGRSFNQVRKDTKRAEERLLALLGDDPDLLDEANALLDEVADLRREHTRMATAQAEARTRDKVADRVEREVLSRFVSGRPNMHVVKAEARVRALMRHNNATAQRESEEALWALNVAHGYATARALDTSGGVSAFRAQVVAALEVWTNESRDEVRAAALRWAAKKVARMLPAPETDAEDDVGTDPGATSEGTRSTI